MEVRDIPAVQAIEVRSFSNPWHKTTFLGEVQNRSIAYPVVAETPDRVLVGYIMFWLIDSEAQINNVAVHPDYRGLGVGEALMRFALAKIRDLGGVTAVLEVRVSNAPARTLYEKLGFRVVGRRKGYYHRPPEDALVMVLNLTA